MPGRKRRSKPSPTILELRLLPDGCRPVSRTDVPGNFRPVDKAKLKASMDRLWEIYRQIGETANLVSKWRCPYKDARDRCTAGFGCRNQSRRARFRTVASLHRK